ncbi:MAG: IPT/TIG domain-containing protein [Acidobacteria bacterium]|nr:IPT/TIG domain-containing protein [Acidobacteriota bacterium]MBV9475714.1 IPT/TIG domain-containing protein [Acidobacteriota bacterium]
MMKRLVVVVLFALPLFGQAVDLAVDIAPSQNSVVYGGTLTGVVHVSNTGGAHPDQGISISVHATDGAGFASLGGTNWTCSRAGAQHEFGICGTTANLTGAYPDINFQVTAPAYGSTFDILAGGNESTDGGAPQHDSETITLAEPFTFTVVPTVDPNPVHAREPFTATYTMNNLGPQTSGNLQLQVTFERLPEFVSASGIGWTCTHQEYPFVLCQHAPVAANVTTTVTVMAIAPAAGGPNTTTGSLFSNGMVWNGSLVYDSVERAELSVGILGPNAAPPDATVDHQVSVTNAGPGDASNVTLSLSATTAIVHAEGIGWNCSGATCTRPSIPAHMQAPYVTVTTATPSTGTLTLTAAVSATTVDTNSADDEASIDVQTGALLVLASITPHTGSVAGGTTLTLTGDGFQPGAVVLVDDVAVPTTFVSPTTLTATTPAHDAGAVDITVLNPDSTSATLANGFLFDPGRHRAVRH